MTTTPRQSFTDGVALGLLRLRPDGRHDVADHVLADSVHGCATDGDCILADRHAGDCCDDRDLWVGPDTLYVSPRVP